MADVATPNLRRVLFLRVRGLFEGGLERIAVRHEPPQLGVFLCACPVGAYIQLEPYGVWLCRAQIG